LVLARPFKGNNDDGEESPRQQQQSPGAKGRLGETETKVVWCLPIHPWAGGVLQQAKAKGKAHLPEKREDSVQTTLGWMCGRSIRPTEPVAQRGAR